MLQCVAACCSALQSVAVCRERVCVTPAHPQMSPTYSQKRPKYLQKSPTHLPKSPANLQKSSAYRQKSPIKKPYISAKEALKGRALMPRERTLRSRKRVLQKSPTYPQKRHISANETGDTFVENRTKDSAKEHYKRDLCILKNALYIRKRARPYPQKGPTKETYTSSKNPYISAKEPYKI